MEIQKAYQEFIQSLLGMYSSSEAAIITDNIFETLLGLRIADRNAAKNLTLSLESETQLKTALEQLKNGMPYAYVQGKAWFYNLPFIVSPAVLIPRPETEELLELFLNSTDHLSSVIDIGTGSGCIPVILKMKLKDSIVWAIDVSNEALKIAKKNADNHKVIIEFKAIDFLNEVSWNELPAFDAIISNPPYIPQKNRSEMEATVKDHEPALALFVPDEEPLIFYKKIYSFAKDHLRKDGKIFLETHHDNAEEVASIFKEEYHTEVRKDMSGNDRFVVATLFR